MGNRPWKQLEQFLADGIRGLIQIACMWGGGLLEAYE